LRAYYQSPLPVQIKCHTVWSYLGWSGLPNKLMLGSY
jgi:hypothetical protein